MRNGSAITHILNEAKHLYMQPLIPQKGYIGPFTTMKTSVFIHWTFPVGGIFVAFFLGDVTWGTIVPLVVAYTTLILIHELGHAFAAIAAGSKVYVVLITGAGGWCFADEPNSLRSRFAFYAGGIIAQILVLLFTVLLLITFGNPSSKVINLFALVFTLVNFILIVINLLPSEGTDGRKIWDLFKELRRRA